MVNLRFLLNNFMSSSFLPTKGRIQVVLLRLFGYLPLSVGRTLGSFIGYLLSYTKNYNSHTTKINIHLCYPHLSSQEKQQLIRSSLEHTGMLAFEMAMVWHKPYSWLEKHITAIKGFELYEAALAKGRGVILLAPHLGNWEVIGQYVSTRYPLMNMYEPPASPELDQLISASRNKTGGLVAPANTRGLAMLLKHLKAGHTVGILPDQVPEDRNRGGITAPFFNQPAYTMTLVTQMIKKTKCQAMSIVAVRVKDGFELRFSEVPDALYSEDERVSVTALNQNVQNLVEKIPEQYQWEYKRFKGVKGMRKIY